MLQILTFDYKCRCGTPLRIPIRPEFENPLYVMEVEKQHKLLERQLHDMGIELMKLARECLDAGVKPEILERADRLREMLKEWERFFKDSKDEN